MMMWVGMWKMFLAGPVTHYNSLLFLNFILEYKFSTLSLTSTFQLHIDRSSFILITTLSCTSVPYSQASFDRSTAYIYIPIHSYNQSPHHTHTSPSIRIDRKPTTTSLPLYRGSFSYRMSGFLPFTIPDRTSSATVTNTITTTIDAEAKSVWPKTKNICRIFRSGAWHTSTFQLQLWFNPRNHRHIQRSIQHFSSCLLSSSDAITTSLAEIEAVLNSSS